MRQTWRVRNKIPSRRKSRLGLASTFGRKKDEMSGGEARDGEGDSTVLLRSLGIWAQDVMNKAENRDEGNFRSTRWGSLPL